MKSVLLSIIVLIQITQYHCFVRRLSRPHYIECQSSEECGSVACCVIGHARFSLPECKPFLEIGEVCGHPDNLSFNTTVMYPDGAEVELLNVHRTVCPCAAGLKCSNERICIDPTLSDNLNSIDSDSYNYK